MIEELLIITGKREFFSSKKFAKANFKIPIAITKPNPSFNKNIANYRKFLKTGKGFSLECPQDVWEFAYRVEDVELNHLMQYLNKCFLSNSIGNPICKMEGSSSFKKARILKFLKSIRQLRKGILVDNFAIPLGCNPYVKQGYENYLYPHIADEPATCMMGEVIKLNYDKSSNTIYHHTDFKDYIEDGKKIWYITSDNFYNDIKKYRRFCDNMYYKTMNSINN
jgi:hypothetical protein